MKRFGGLFPQVIAFDNLISGAWRAARGRRDRPEVARFLLELEPEILRLQAELAAGSYRPGELSTFVVRDPKVRTITVAPFRDRVVHQAVCAPLEPVFERLAIFDSHACRKGHLTSQHLANFYLGAFDRWVVHELRPGAYVRYMDDMVLFAAAKAELREMQAACEHRLADRLRLSLKAAATRLAPVSEGLTFLGRRIFPGVVRIRRENLRRSLRRLRGRGYPEDSVRSVFAHLAQADSRRLRLDLAKHRC